MTFTDIFYMMGDDIVYLLLFFIFFAMIFTILGRVGILRDAYGRPNKPTIVVVALCVSLLTTYGIYRSGYDFMSIFYGLGFSLDSIYPIFLIAILVIALLVIWWLRFSGFLIIAGILLAGITLFTEMVYEKTPALVISGILILIGLWAIRRRRRRALIATHGSRAPPRRRWWPFESI